MTPAEFGWYVLVAVVGGVLTAIIVGSLVWICKNPSVMGSACHRAICALFAGATWPLRAVWRRFLAAATGNLAAELRDLDADIGRIRQDVTSLRGLFRSLQERLAGSDPQQSPGSAPDHPGQGERNDD